MTPIKKSLRYTVIYKIYLYTRFIMCFFAVLVRFRLTYCYIMYRIIITWMKFVQIPYYVKNVNNVNRFKCLLYSHVHRHTHIRTGYREFMEVFRWILYRYNICIRNENQYTQTPHTHTRARAYVEAIGKKEKTVNHNFLPRFGIYMKRKKNHIIGI